MFDRLTKDELITAIAQAERGHRGELRVHLERRCPERTPLAERAAELFDSLGMHRTRDDTAVLFYLSVDDGRCALHAGAGVRDARSAGFWRAVEAEIQRGFAIGEPLAGVCAAIEQIGDVLREHAPGEDVAGNELPDAVTTS